MQSRRACESRRSGPPVAWLYFKEKGNLTTARGRYEESLDIFRVTGDAVAIALTLHALGELSCYEGNLEEAEALAEESLTKFQELGMKHHAGTLAVVAWRRGQHERA